MKSSALKFFRTIIFIPDLISNNCKKKYVDFKTEIQYTVIGGLLLGYLAVATGSLWPSVILHFVNNLYSVVVIATNDNLGENASVLAVILMLICFTVIGVIGLIRLIKLKYKVTMEEDSKLLTTREKISAFVKNGPMIVAIIMITVITISNINF